MDWFTDDGINIGMLSDVQRNRFYEHCLKDTADKKCIEVGCGTGLLTVLALEQGATKVLSYENNFERYCLAKENLNLLSYSKQVDLKHQTFEYNKEIHNDYDLLFHEIIGTDLYDEGVSCLLNTDLPVIPAVAGTEWFVQPIDEKRYYSCTQVQQHELKILQRAIQCYQSIKDPSWPTCSNQKDFRVLSSAIKNECLNDFGLNCDTLQCEINIHTGLKQLEKFDNLINNRLQDWILDYYNKSAFVTKDDIVTLDYSQKVGDTCVDFNHNCKEQYLTLTLDENTIKYDFYMLYARHYLEHHEQRLQLSDDTHWGNNRSQGVIKNLNKNLQIKQNIHNGVVTYTHE